MKEGIFNNIDKIAMEHYGINPKLIENAQRITEDVQPVFREIEKIVEFNQFKILAAMKESFLSDYHLNDSTGYGYNDMGRETIEQIYKDIFKAEDALVRSQIVSGTHAITLCLLGVLRPGDELLSVTGTPYDTLKDVILGDNCGSLKDYHIKYREIRLADGKPDYDKIKENINKNTRMVIIQRSRGYSMRPALSISEIQQLIAYVKSLKNNLVCFVDNCYGEFVDIKEPIEIGADLCAGSLIKNPGGGIAPTGGYVIGKSELVKQCSYRLTAPGLDKNCGSSLFSNRLIVQGLFYAPLVVGEALKGAVFTSRMLEHMGFKVFPKYDEKRSDIVTAVVLKNKNALISFCKGIQKVGPVDSHVQPEPWAMPGYDHQIIMAGGSFIQGSSIELSADAPLREPYAVYIQGGLNFSHVKLGIMSGLQALIDNGNLK
ncbi:MAG: methionine gamma-lyase family protein [Tepidanaerobacteraceae bacterium]|nr:methionine gamma-lyase family protein [Tepidanaerobacteraceae bacterium]